jgi:hypothetical protein
MGDIVRFSVRAYGWLLRLYPISFRREYGREMLLVFGVQCREAYRRAGMCGIIKTWMRTLGDLALTIPAEHFSTYKGVEPMIRRGFDIAVALLMLWIGLPFLLPIALLIKLDSPGPVFYVSQRVGRNGHPFTMFKLRSMTNAPAGRRVTRIGRFLRSTRLDEYPQCYNVLRGDMSLFGPRPLMPERAETFLLVVKPGLVPRFSR